LVSLNKADNCTQLSFSYEDLRVILFEELKLATETSFAVAYSGGLDSQALLHGMSKLAEIHDIKLLALHYDHGIHNESALWCQHCREWSRQSGVAFLSYRGKVECQSGESLEAKARFARYCWFEQILEPGQVLLTAHHADDQAETILMNLLRGKGVEQLQGMAQSRPLTYRSSINLVRPLLKITKSALVEYAKLQRLSWIEDFTNQQTRFDRNYLRHNVLPEISARWPSAVSNITAVGKKLGAYMNAYHRELEKRYQQSVCPKKRGVFCLTDPLCFDLLTYEECDTFTDLVRLWIHRAGFFSPSNRQLEMLFSQCVGKALTSGAFICGCYVIRIFNYCLYLIDYPIAPNRHRVNYDFKSYTLEGINVELTVQEKLGRGFSQKVRNEIALDIVWRSGGEKVRLPGRRHHHSLKKLYQSKGVPPWERKYLPYLAHGDEIAWVAGIGIMEGYRCMDKEIGIYPQFSRLCD